MTPRRCPDFVPARRRRFAWHARPIAAIFARVLTTLPVAGAAG
jgi:hypothetical protein